MLAWEDGPEILVLGVPCHFETVVLVEGNRERAHDIERRNRLVVTFPCARKISYAQREMIDHGLFERAPALVPQRALSRALWSNRDNSNHEKLAPVS